MDNRFLITTGLEKTIPKNQPLLLLGEWCRSISQKDKFTNLNIKILPYHWDDRRKLQKDYLYLNTLYEKLLIELTYKLNKIHGTNHKTRYWRILIGPWLGYFVQIMFDRWSSITSAISNYELSGTFVQSFKKDLLIPKNMRHFNRLIRSDEWNHFIYAYIIKNYTKINIIYQDSKYEIIQEKSRHQYQFKRRLKEKILDFTNILLRIFQRNNNAFLINTYLSKKDEILLNFKLSQIPIFHSNMYLGNIEFEYKKEKREWKLFEKSQNEFENLTRSIIPLQMPKIYLEGFKYLNEKISSSFWPSKPKIIFTSGSFTADDFFKLYVAKKTEEGFPLAIGQHGGGIGTHLFAFYEKHQIDISDLYLSWGWKDKLRENIKSIGIFKDKKPLRVNHGSQSKILLLAIKLPRHSYHIWSAPIASQALNNFIDQCNFINSLNAKIKDKLTVRLKQIDQDEEPSLERWIEKFPYINYDDGSSNINKLLAKSRLCISTYNATTFLETLSMNVPTVIFWNPNHWELREPAVKHFHQLKKVGVFHDTPESAARHVNFVWEDVNLWWNSKVVQDAVNSFKDYYCKKPKNLVNLIHTEFIDFIKK